MNALTTDSLLFKTDWADCRRMFADWWTRAPNTPAAVGVLAPRDRPLPGPTPPPAPSDDRTRWLDTAGNLARREAFFASRYYGGAWHPYLTAELGPCPLAVFLGSPPRFGPDTVWYDPAFAHPAGVELRFDPENPYWQWVVTTLGRCRSAAPGRFSLAIPSLVEGLDVLSELFGTQELLTYLVDCPEEIHRLLAQLETVYFQVYEPLYELARADQGGVSFSHFSVWAPARAALVQCDFSCMISEEMFAEFVVPSLTRQCARLDYTMYHLDGPNAVRHLKHLVKIPRLTAIEWTPGAGQPYAANRAWWDKVWRPIYAAGKSAHCWATPIETIAPFVKEFGARGTLITTGANTEAEARNLIAHSVDWGR